MAPPGNQAETENTNIDLQRWEKLIYSTLPTSATFILGKSLASIATAINEGLSSQERGNEKLLLAMELFASARQESTERSRFVGLVSSLEPLAEQQSYTGEVSGMIDRFKDQIKELKLLPHIEASLSGRIANLSTESVSSAIRRVVKETLPDDSEALRIIEDAYNLRSRILHDGTTDADLNQKSREVETVVRRVIASRAALNLRVS
ncbi:MAG: HEPN domain-containing protein [Chloroflexota bacterium]|nr:HEPN domain-containing protein [Chloroflexota bacterium]